MHPLLGVRSMYLILDDVISNINETLKLMLGTHNFHNFTSRK